MEIANLTEEFIAKKKKKAYARDKNRHGLMVHMQEEAWKLGWKAAMRFVRNVTNAYGICEQCGRFIMNENDLCTDAEGVVFCKKCYEKVFLDEEDDDREIVDEGGPHVSVGLESSNWFSHWTDDNDECGALSHWLE